MGLPGILDRDVRARRRCPGAAGAGDRLDVGLHDLLVFRAFPVGQVSREIVEVGHEREVEVEPGCGRLSPQVKSRAQSKELTKDP